MSEYDGSVKFYVRADSSLLDSDLKKALAKIESFSESVEDALNVLAQEISNALSGSTEKCEELKSIWNDLEKTIDGTTEKTETKTNTSTTTEKKSSGKYDIVPLGKRAKSGLDYIPHDEFPAVLHEGEKVLSKEEASEYRDLQIETAEPSGAGLYSGNYGERALSVSIEPSDVILDGYTVGKIVFRNLDDVKKFV